MTLDNLTPLITLHANNVACHLVGNADVSLDEARVLVAAEIDQAVTSALDLLDSFELVTALKQAVKDRESWLAQFMARGEQLRAVSAALSFDPKVDRDLETCGRRIYAERDDAQAQAERERTQRQLDVGAQEYRGNTVSYMYDKAKCYGDMVHGCSLALAEAGFPVSEDDPHGRINAIANAVKSLAAHAASLAQSRDDAVQAAHLIAEELAECKRRGGL